MTSNLITQFKQANGEEPSAEELKEMISEMKEAGLYDEAAARISELLGAGADEDGEESEGEEAEEVIKHSPVLDILRASVFNVSVTLTDWLCRMLMRQLRRY